MEVRKNRNSTVIDSNATVISCQVRTCGAFVHVMFRKILFWLENYLFQQVVHFFFLIFPFVSINKNNQPPFLFFSQEEKPSYPPRLFQCSNASGAFRVEEIFEFCQEVSMYICFSLPFRLMFIHVVLMMNIE